MALTEHGIPMGLLKASVVIASRNRPEVLAGCLAALKRQEGAPPFEIILVDDGSRPSIKEALRPIPSGVLVLRTECVGPARARNAGIAQATGGVILFTDDDTIPSSRWVASACAFLDAHPGHCGVEGPVQTDRYDVLTEYSVENYVPGAYWTCNVAYRRDVLEEVGGFSSDYPHPHCEDRDLGFRTLRLGPIGFAEDMRVHHRVRHLRVSALARRARQVDSEILLRSRFPERFPPTAPVPLWAEPLLTIARDIKRQAVTEGRRLANPRRALLFIALSAGRFYYASTTVTRFRLKGTR